MKDLSLLFESRKDLIIETRLNMVALPTLVITLLPFFCTKVIHGYKLPSKCIRKFLLSALGFIKLIVRID